MPWPTPTTGSNAGWRTAGPKAQLNRLGGDPFMLNLARWDANRRCPPPLLYLHPSESGWELAVSFSPDGRLAASGGWGPMRVWELPTGRKIADFGNQADGVWNFHASAFSPDNRFLFAGNESGTIFQWDLQSDKLVQRWQAHPKTVHSLCVLNDTTLLSGCWDGSFKKWNIKTATELFSSKLSYGVDTILPFPDGKRVLCGGAPVVLDLNSGATLYALEGLTSQSGLALSPDGKRICGGYAGDVNFIGVWDADTGRLLKTLAYEGYTLRPGGVRILPDNRTAITCDSDGQIRAWDIEKGGIIASRGWTNIVHHCAVSPDGRFVISGGGDGAVMLWGVAAAPELRWAQTPGLKNDAIALSNDHRFVAINHRDGWVRLWDFATGRKLGIVARRDPQTNSLAFSPSGNSLLLAPMGNGIREIDLRTGKTLRTFAVRRPSLRGLCVSADGKIGLTGGTKGDLQLWDMTSGQELVRPGGFVGHTQQPFHQYALSADGSRAVSLTERVNPINSVPCVFDTTTGKLLWTRKSWDFPLSVAIAPDGVLAAYGESIGIIRVWDSSTGRETSSAKNFNGVHALAFTPDGQTLISAPWTEFSLDFIDAHTLEGLHSISLPRKFGRFAFSPDMQALATSDNLQFLDFSRTGEYPVWEARLGRARKTLVENPDDPLPLADLAEWYAFRGEYQTAIDLAKRARAGGADVSPLALARCYWQCDLPQEASAEFAEALARHEMPRSLLATVHGSDDARVRRTPGRRSRSRRGRQ